MKNIIITIVMMVNCSILLAEGSIRTLDSVSDFLSEEECWYFDSLLAVSSLLDTVGTATKIKTTDLELSTRAATNYSYATTYYIAHDPSRIDRIGRILILCDCNTYIKFTNKIVRYAKDIHNAYGCAVLIYSVTGGDAQNIKQLIKENYEPDASFLSGVILVGNIAAASFYTPAYQEISITKKDTVKWSQETFPCDYYYMDLDGIWTDTNNDAKFDTHTGDIKPEIFVGRICAYNMQNIDSSLNIYFDKNHAYWSGQKSIKRKKGLSFTYRDWSTLAFRTGLQQLYGMENTDNIQDDQCTKPNYINAIEDSAYEFVQFACHSNNVSHSFEKGNNVPKLTMWELDTIDIQTLGYNLFCCKACRWTESNGCLGEHYLYSTCSETLSLVGSSKSGGMLDGLNTFYKYLGEGDCMGTAYRIWWKDIVSNISNVGRRQRWYYGMCILGDPLVNFLYDNQCNEDVNISSWNQNNSSNIHIYHAQDEIIASCTIPVNKTLELHANRIRLTNGFHAGTNTNLHISVDPCYDNNSSAQRISQRYENPRKTAPAEEIPNTTGIQIFPNPCATTLSIRGVLGDKLRYKMYDINGLLVNSGFNNGENIDVSTLPNGLYMLTIQDEDMNIIIDGFKIIKQ